MLDVRNRELAEATKVDDFIVSDHLISLMMTQLSENAELAEVFDDLFDPEGSEIYLKPAGDYVRRRRAGELLHGGRSCPPARRDGHRLPDRQRVPRRGEGVRRAHEPAQVGHDLVRARRPRHRDRRGLDAYRIAAGRRRVANREVPADNLLGEVLAFYPMGDPPGTVGHITPDRHLRLCRAHRVHDAARTQ